MYNVKVSKRVTKYISKLGSKDRDYFISRFNELKHDKSGYKQLDVYRKTELWELRCSSHRVYYTVEGGYIVISDIEYEGNIFVLDASNKNQQHKKINYLKHKIRHI